MNEGVYGPNALPKHRRHAVYSAIYLPCRLDLNENLTKSW
jgi:hypothetical protein